MSLPLDGSARDVPSVQWRENNLPSAETARELDFRLSEGWQDSVRFLYNGQRQ